MCPPASSSNRGQPAFDANKPTAIPSCIPLDQLSQQSYEYAAKHLQPTILNHSIRVYLHAKALDERESSTWTTQSNRLPLLFTACILHDIGTTSPHDGSQRFEVEGADAAASILHQCNVETETDIHDVWTAIALHTSPGIAERITPLARLVRLGVTIDFKRPAALALASAAEVEAFEDEFPRMEIEKVLGDVVVEQAMHRPEKAPAASWPGILVSSARANPGWEGVNRAF